MTPDADLLVPLRRYWGYSTFRPLQERIVRSLLAGHDACVVMPTGGGKSLCYQLPAALLADRTVLVVSPLIALMQDQVAQLTQMGISAALLNSTIPAGTPAHERAAEKFSGAAHRPVYGQRDAASAARHHESTGAADPGPVYRQLSPA